MLNLAATLALALLAAPQERLTRGGVAPAKDDTLMLYYGDDPNTLNPITSNDTVSGEFMRWVVEALADRRFDDPEQFEPVLAESWTFDEKNLEYTIHLRKGILWHPAQFPDGTPIPAREFTADDVKFTFDCILNRHVDAASLRSYYEDPGAQEESERFKIRVSVTDPYTIKVRWTQPYFLAEEFTLGVAPLPQHIYSVDEKGEPLSLDVSSEEFARGFNEHWFNSRLCGTGQMMFSEWKKNERLELARNPAYWGKPFYFSRVVFRNIPNANTALQKLLSAEIDSASIPEKDLYLKTREEKAVKDGKVALFDYEYPGYRYVGWNLKRDIFKDPAVRRALACATPVQKIIDKVLHGLASRLSGPFLPGSRACDATLQPLEYALEKARALLDVAGWKDSNGNGIRDKAIGTKMVELRFDLMIYSDSSTYSTIAEILKEEYRQIGVDVQISPSKWALMLEKLNKKEFDACMLGWAMGWKDDPYQIWHGSQADTPESSNTIGYKNPELDKLIETLRVTFDPKEQEQLYHRIHRIIYDDQPYLFLFTDRATGGRLSRIRNVKPYKIRPCRDAREWYAPPEDARR